MWFRKLSLIHLSSNFQSEMDWERIGWQADPEGLEWKEDTSPIELGYYANFSWFSLDWNDATAERVTAKTGVDLNFMKPVVDDGQKLNMMIAGNQLPDILTLDKNDAALKKMAEAGMLWPLDELIEDVYKRQGIYGLHDTVPVGIYGDLSIDFGEFSFLA